MIDNSFVNEQVRAITEPELIFYQNYNLLIYLKDSRLNLNTAEEDSLSNLSSNKSDNVDDVDNLMSPFY